MQPCEAILEGLASCTDSKLLSYWHGGALARAQARSGQWKFHCRLNKFAGFEDLEFHALPFLQLLDARAWIYSRSHGTIDSIKQ